MDCIGAPDCRAVERDRGRAWVSALLASRSICLHERDDEGDAVFGGPPPISQRERMVDRAGVCSAAGMQDAGDSCM